MKINEIPVTLRDGRTAVLRTARPEEAQAVLDLMRITSGETHFMARYPDETVASLEKEIVYLTDQENSPTSFQLCAIVDGKLVGAAGINPISPISNHRKMRHRAGFGTSILKDYCDCGLGTLMLETCLKYAREIGYTQVELGVFDDNPRAIHVYEKLGFQRMGTIPRAFHLDDGTWHDEHQMVCFLED